MQIALLRSRTSSLTARTAVAVGVLATVAAGETSSSWIQVARVGTFKNYWSGGKLRTFTITDVMLKEMHDNFIEGRHPVPPTQLCIDYEHLSSPDVPLTSPVQGKAAGWVKAVALREDNQELWAEIEWTDPAADAIRAKEFQYFSPEFAFDYTTHDASKIGCTLLAGAITNRPFIQGMEAVQLRAGGTADVLAAELSFDQRRVFVERALTDHYRALNAGNANCHDWYVYVCDIYDDAVVFSVAGGRKFRCTYDLDGAGTVVLGEFEEVVISYEPLSSGAEGDVMSKDPKATIKLTDRDGKAIEVAADVLESTDLVKDLRAQLSQRVPKADHEALQTQVVTLTGRVDALTQTNEATTKLLAERDAAKAVEDLIADGKASAGQKESLTELYLSNRDLFTKVTAGMPKVVETGERGHGGGGGQEGGTTVVDEVNTAITDAMKADTTLTYATASERVFAKDPGLYGRYVKASEQKVGKSQ